MIAHSGSGRDSWIGIGMHPASQKLQSRIISEAQKILLYAKDSE